MTQKGAQWVWTEGCNNAFFELKKLLMSSPILALPDLSLDCVLDTDASGDGLGAVLSQMTNGEEEQVLAYTSSALRRSERKYCATRREMLALVWAARHFLPYLYGKKFVLRTDHHSLQWLHKFKELEGQVARWLEVLSLTTQWCTVQVSDSQMLMHYHVAGAASVDWRRRKRTKPYPVMLYHTSCYQLGLKRRLRLNRVLTLTIR